MPQNIIHLFVPTDTCIHDINLYFSSNQVKIDAILWLVTNSHACKM